MKKINKNKQKVIQAGSFVYPVLLLIILCFSSGCAGNGQDIVKIPEPLEPPVIISDKPLSPGSLWTGNEGGWISDIRARRVGDIVTVIISEKASASKEASTATDRTSGIKTGIPTLFGLEQQIIAAYPNMNPANLIEASFNNNFQGSGKTTRREDLIATLTTQVIKVYPNGNMMIRGGKSVIVNNENQIIHLTGIVRPWDVSAANEINSAKILNAQIAYTGKGIISDKQKPGWLTRVVDNVWPF
jgi:flagellar L-ring protein precursor FlgH